MYIGEKCSIYDIIVINGNLVELIAKVNGAEVSDLKGVILSEGDLLEVTSPNPLVIKALYNKMN